MVIKIIVDIVIVLMMLSCRTDDDNDDSAFGFNKFSFRFGQLPFISVLWCLVPD